MSAYQASSPLDMYWVDLGFFCLHGVSVVTRLVILGYIIDVANASKLEYMYTSMLYILLFMYSKHKLQKYSLVILLGVIIFNSAMLMLSFIILPFLCSLFLSLLWPFNNFRAHFNGRQ